MKRADFFHKYKCDGSSLMLNINKKQESIPNPSYSMMHSLEDGFSTMMYSCTYETAMGDGCVHMKYAVRLILTKRIAVM